MTGLPPRKTPSQARLWSRTFVLAWVANFLTATAFHSYVHLPGWLEIRGAGELLIGVLMAVGSIAAIGARPLVGRTMDTRGRRMVIVIGGLVHLLVPAIYLLANTMSPGSWWLIAVGRIVHGLAQAALFSVLFTVAADIVPAQRRAEGIALFGVSGLIPLAIGGLLGEVVIVDGEYAGLFWMTGVAATGGFLCSLPLPETRRGGPSRSFMSAALAPELRPLWFIGATFAIGLAAYFVFIKTFLLTRPELGTTGTFFGVYTAAAVFSRVFFGRVPERFGLIVVLIPSLLLGALGLAILAVATVELHMILAAIVCGVSHGFAFPIISALVVTRAQADERGSAVALFTALFDFGVLIGGPAFGLSVRLFDYPTSFALTGGLIAICTLIFVVWNRASERAARDPRADLG